MQPAFWQQRWQEGRIGFHQPNGNPMLARHWPALGLEAGAVFVPLCGKSLDMRWLVERGHRVIGCELVEQAAREFFAEWQRSPSIESVDGFIRYAAAGVEIWVGDVFDLHARHLADCVAFYDRAALIALPPALRERYAREVFAHLPATAGGLIITLEYPQHEMNGPPFSVAADEVARLFGRRGRMIELERIDILDREPGFVEQGITHIDTVAYRLAPRWR